MYKAATLTYSQVSIDGCVSSSTSQVLVLSVWNVEMSLRVAIFLSETKINNINLVATFSNTHKKVVGFDIAVNERLRMNIFDTRYLYNQRKEVRQKNKLTS